MKDLLNSNAPASTFVAAAAAALLATAASGSFYQWDDGTSEMTIGLTQGGELAWMNVFEVDATAHIITSISTGFGTPLLPSAAGVTPGQLFRVHLWGDNDGNPSTGMTHLGSWDAFAEAGSISTDVLQTVWIDPTDVSAFSHFVIGASISLEVGAPAPIDTSEPSLGRSWVAGHSSSWDPTNPAEGIGVHDLDDLGFSGLALLRANGIPAPGGVALIALAGLASRPRRRE